jgi:hypothetical protein
VRSSFQNNVDILVSQPTSLLFIRKVARLLARPLPECVCAYPQRIANSAAHALPPRVYLNFLGLLRNSFVPRDEASLILSDASNTTKAALFADFLAPEFASKILSLRI